MCTASWSVGVGRAALCFNRDERKDRTRALPPTLLKQSGFSCLAPIDGEAGGTWLLINEQGLCVFVLNCYVSDARGVVEKGVQRRSRGMLPLELARCHDVESGISSLEGLDLSAYQPVYIGLLDRMEAAVCCWDGARLERRAEIDGFITTSSFEPQLVQAYRKRRYETLVGSGAAAGLPERLNYHKDLAHANPAYNPFMSRAEAETQSLSVVELDAREARIQYLERLPGEFRWNQPVGASLELHRPE